uniref:ATP synthase subunit a n=1 Tax=Scelio sp. ZJUH_2016028 TaxID=2496283 RepID=A0A3S8V141_9HYME|nr:ATP synthase F0 subunit 6 [Scelio sp. ZJUH_2016028]
MMNLFSIFDPSINMYISMNWLMMLLPMMFLISSFWLYTSRWNMLIQMMLMYLNTELSVILKKKIYKMNFMSIFIMITLINFISLNSYVFTGSSHMSMNLALSLPMWLNFMLMGWIFNYKHMLAHQVPNGTPPILMPFMVIIEMISNIIRPGTLSVRLTANMIAGHLILTLISMNGNKMMIITSISLIIPLILLSLLEMAVAIIQSYVFMMLLSLYSQEI